jgi:ABC-type proline/glycine betaine transport system permease subunit
LIFLVYRQQKKKEAFVATLHSTLVVLSGFFHIIIIVPAGFADAVGQQTKWIINNANFIHRINSFAFIFNKI